ncbi:MAG: metalloregulator ArsR/SmtB family transcription factor [Acidobacteriota bacterium]|nr:metalloregulator ArsR/SmtB family transcription factor [Acidobacteriota bacterium]
MATTLSAPACGSLHDTRELARLTGALMPSGDVTSVSDLFKMLGDGTRVRILDTLSHGERCVCDIATVVGMSESAVSHQLRLLRTTRLVRVRRAGRQAFYALDDHHIIGLLHDARRHVQESR